jgi:hypothetical protein
MHEGTSIVYRIVVRGELSERYTPIFEEMEVKVKSEHTVIIGQVIDQPSLHSILHRIVALGLEQVSVDSWPAEHQDATNYPSGSSWMTWRGLEY